MAQIDNAINRENKAVSAFHIQAEKAKQVLDEKEEQDKDPLNKKFLRYKTGKKGKGEGLSDKIKGAGVGDWREQKLTKLSFFENMRKIFSKQIKIMFNKVYQYMTSKKILELKINININVRI